MKLSSQFLLFYEMMLLQIALSGIYVNNTDLFFKMYIIIEKVQNGRVNSGNAKGET